MQDWWNGSDREKPKYSAKGIYDEQNEVGTCIPIT